MIFIIAKSIRVLFFFFLSSVFIIGCQTIDESKNQDPDSKIWGKPSNGLRCSIASDKTGWFDGEPAIVSIIFENVSKGKLELKTIPAFILNEMQYWCPVHITGEDYNLPANTRVKIFLEKGCQISSMIDISQLGWDQGISSIWPSKNFYSIVPTGKYKLRLDIEIIDGTELLWIRSNEITVEIYRKPSNM